MNEFNHAIKCHRCKFVSGLCGFLVHQTSINVWTKYIVPCALSCVCALRVYLLYICRVDTWNSVARRTSHHPSAVNTFIKFYGRLCMHRIARRPPIYERRVLVYVTHMNTHKNTSECCCASIKNAIGIELSSRTRATSGLLFVYVRVRMRLPCM